MHSFKKWCITRALGDTEDDTVKGNGNADTNFKVTCDNGGGEKFTKHDANRLAIAIYRISFAAYVGRDPVTVSGIWNRWVLGDNTERRAGSQRPPITSHLEDRPVIHLALMECASPSRALNQELGSFVRKQVSARTIRRRLQQHGISTQRPWPGYP
ncbi:HTH_Tnp_Tc3_2 domain-containing protein [Trichonephila clavipes]|nr:HTH_Tnp_Tc3_2 domain-containing protein [Trichonephila clavipes]